MKTDVKIYAFVREDAEILKIIEKEYDYILIQDYDALKKKIDNISYLDSHLLLIDLAYVMNEKGIINKYIRQDLMRSWLAVVGYSSDVIALNIKMRLYRLDFKALLDYNNVNIHAKIFKHVRNYANIHMETLQNNFIKALQHFNNLDKPLRELKYLIDYIVDYYKLSIQDAADIYLVTATLVMALQTDAIAKISEEIFITFKSLEVNKLYRNYASAKTFHEQLVCILLQTLHLKNAKSHLATINMQNVPENLKKEVPNFYESKIILISSYLEIDIFWEQIHYVLFNQYANDNFDIIENYLEIVYHALVHSLNRVGYICAYINITKEKDIAVFIDFFDVDDAVIEECLALIETNEARITTTIDKHNVSNKKLIIRLSVSKKSVPTNLVSTKASGILKHVNIAAMHYKEHQKISAQEFLQEFEVDSYMLDDLNENETEMKDILYNKVELDNEVLDAVCGVLEKYIHVLHETIEFNDLAISLESLSKVFQRLPVNMLEVEKKEKLRFYIQGLIDDLATWKKYIFIEPNTPDIHYLDASLLENCASIERFIFASPEEEAIENDDDLEFF